MRVFALTVLLCGPATGYPYFLDCDRSVEPGEFIMWQTAVASNMRYIWAETGGNAYNEEINVNCGDSFTMHISDTEGHYLFETKIPVGFTQPAGKFETGTRRYCENRRVDSQGETFTVADDFCGMAEIRAGFALQKGIVSVSEKFLFNVTCPDVTNCALATPRPTTFPSSAPTLSPTAGPAEKNATALYAVVITVVVCAFCCLVYLMFRISNRMEEVNRRVTISKRLSKRKKKKKRSKRKKKGNGGLGLKKKKKKKKKINVVVQPAA